MQMTLRDFAKKNGVSYEAVRQQVKRYAADLEGHIHQQGRTQFLDDVAISFLESKRAQNPLVVYDQDRDEELKDLRDKVDTLREKLIAAQELALAARGAMVEAQAARLALDVAEKEIEQRRKELDQARQQAQEAQEHSEQLQMALAASEQEAKILEGFVADAKAEIRALTDEKAEEVAAARQETKAAVEAQFRSMSLWEFLREKRKKGE